MLASEFLAYLLAVAIELSGYPPLAVQDLPAIAVLPPARLAAEACPMKQEQCREIVALFDGDHRRILISDILDLTDAADNSFLVHELVHVLEYSRNGGHGPQGCPAILRSERVAYRVQNAYLRQQGRSERFGGMMMRMVCSPEQPGDSTIRLELARTAPNDETALQDFLEDLALDRVEQRRTRQSGSRAQEQGTSGGPW